MHMNGIRAHLEDMAPVFTFVIEPLVQHLHDFYEVVSAP